MILATKLPSETEREMHRIVLMHRLWDLFDQIERVSKYLFAQGYIASSEKWAEQVRAPVWEIHDKLYAGDPK